MTTLNKIDISLKQNPTATKIINNTNKTICFIQDKDNPNIFRMRLSTDTLWYLDERDDYIICLEPTDWINIKRTRASKS